MKKASTFLVLSFAMGVACAQSADPVTLAYERNFIRASLSSKLELLSDASRITSVNMVQLYIDALSFVLQSYPYLGNDAQLMEIAVSAASKASIYQDPAVIPVLRDILNEIPDPKVRIACVGTFSGLAKGRKDDIAFLNDWFAANFLAKNDDEKAFVACVEAIGRIGDPRSFPVLFAAATGNYDTAIAEAASKALNAISEGYTDQILAILGQKDVKKMYAAFSIAMLNDSLPVSDRGRIAETAFAGAVGLIASGTAGNPETLKSLLRDSMDTLTKLTWAQSSPTVVRYFYLVQGDYKNDASGIELMIPVVRCMGAMGTTEAAQALSIFLGLLNSDTEQKKGYNEELMLTVIQALGDLGDKSAFDYLLYVGYLDYTETVKKASRDALARLAW